MNLSLSLLCSLSLLLIVACQTTVPIATSGHGLSMVANAGEGTQFVYPIVLVSLAEKAKQIDPAIALGRKPAPTIVYVDAIGHDNGVPYFRWEGVETYGATDSRSNTIYIAKNTPHSILRHEYLHYLLHTRRGLPIYDHPQTFRDLVYGWE